jgi:hypothetical protein
MSTCFRANTFLKVSSPSALSFPAVTKHIIPFCLPCSELSETCCKEVQSFKAALKALYATQKCELFCFERCVDTRGANHMHIQVRESRNNALLCFSLALPHGLAIMVRGQRHRQTQYGIVAQIAPHS